MQYLVSPLCNHQLRVRVAYRSILSRMFVWSILSRLLVIDATTGGDQAILSSEGYQDIFHPMTQMSLIMWYPGRDIDAMRVALPEYRAAAYSPDAGTIETGLNGWMASGGDRALRSKYTSHPPLLVTSRPSLTVCVQDTPALDWSSLTVCSWICPVVSPYGSKCGAKEPLSGFPGNPCNFPLLPTGAPDPGRTTRWSVTSQDSSIACVIPARF